MTYRFRYVFDRNDETKSILITDDDLHRHGLDLRSIPLFTTLYIDADADSLVIRTPSGDMRMNMDISHSPIEIFNSISRDERQIEEFKTHAINGAKQYYQFLQSQSEEGSDLYSHLFFTRKNAS